jgi:hypothetical protein
MPRRYAPDEATAILLAAGLTPRTPYPGSKAKWPVACMSCGHVFTTTLHQMNRKIGCGRCARPRATCVYPNCGLPAKGLGYCGKHYARLREHGDPAVTKRIARYAADAMCTVDGCTRRVLARGWCSPHYQRWLHHGDPVAGGPSPRPALDHDDGTRTCSDCGERLPLTSFAKDARASLGRRANCKACHSAQARGWYADNDERQRLRQRARYLRDMEVIRQRDRERYERDKDKRIELVVEAGHRRRARLRNAQSDRGITYAALRKRDGDLCVYCQRLMDFSPVDGATFVAERATIEHRVPLAAGGTHTWDNVALSCWQCNVRKNRRSADEWLISLRSLGSSPDADPVLNPTTGMSVLTTDA